MKKLQRPLEPPFCLSQFNHGKDNWNSLDGIHKDNIWEKLNDMQDSFCAYCECFSDKNRHIEHFRKKDHFPRLIFDWSNLFGSCDNHNRCGIHKDDPKTVAYNPDNLIKPDEENPSDYLLFLTGGAVRAKSKLGSTDKKKAEETIRIFNLNGDSSLKNSRKVVLLGVENNILALYEAENDFEESDDWSELLEGELENLKGKEFQTALEHAWKYNQDY